MSNYTEYVEMRKEGAQIVIEVDEESVLDEAKDNAAKIGDATMVDSLASDIATKAVNNELKKSGAYNPDVQSEVVIVSDIPVHL